jgi:hypothetical protein
LFAGATPRRCWPTDGTVLVAGGAGVGSIGWPRDAELYNPSTWTATGLLVHPNQQGSAAALLPNGQVLYAGGYSVVCGVKNCDYPPTAELYTP